jgi:predicted lipoprotein with Yx(FWY)xxD motif
MRIRAGLIAVPLLALTLAACGGGPDADKAADKAAQPAAGNATASASPSPAPANVTVKVAQTALGPILTDEANRTLYAFTKDKGGTSSCADDCIATWPALTTSSQVTAGDGTQAPLLRKTTRTEGTTQASYGEWPLYYYAGDTAPGDLNGQGVDGVWFVVKPDGKLVRADL